MMAVFGGWRLAIWSLALAGLFIMIHADDSQDIGVLVKELRKLIDAPKATVTLQKKSDDAGDVFEGDMILTKEQKAILKEKKMRGNDTQKRGVDKTATLWPGRIVYYEKPPVDSKKCEWIGAQPFCGKKGGGDCISRGLENGHTRRDCSWTGQQICCLKIEKRKTILDAIQHIQDGTCIQFKERNTGNRIVFKYTDACNSRVGMVGGAQTINMADRCFNRGWLIHEIFHALGFLHEQTRLDRDKYVNVNFANIKGGRTNSQFKKNKNHDTKGLPYNIQSIMHYHSTAQNKGGRKSISSKNNPEEDAPEFMGQKDAMTYYDRELVNRAYGCGPAKGSWNKVAYHDTKYSKCGVVRESDCKKFGMTYVYSGMRRCGWWSSTWKQAVCKGPTKYKLECRKWYKRLYGGPPVSSKICEHRGMFFMKYELNPGGFGVKICCG